MSKCASILCELEVYGDSDKCILHSKKNEYQEDRLKIGFLEGFYEELIEYILNNRFPNEKGAKNTVREFLKGHRDENDIGEFFNERPITFEGIFFPERDGRDLFDYKSVLDKIDAVHFRYCEFNISSLDLRKTKLFFDECTFHNRWHLYNHKLLENVKNVLYQVCTFNDSVNTIAVEYDSPMLEKPIFSDCIFKKDINLEGIEFKSSLFKNTEHKPLPAKKIEIIHCTFNEKTILNNYEIEEFNCIGSEFNEKFEFKRNNVQYFLIDDTNFHKIVDCYQTSFGKFKINKSIFYDFGGFEDCIFGNENIIDKNTAKFIYATFLSFISFRDAKFNNGLDLKRINTKGIPNFYNVFISPKDTGRETFRRVKDSFDKVGNYIEANNFYFYEMQKLKEELKTTNQRSRRYLLHLYEFTSNYGQSYIRPLTGLCLSAIIYWIIVIGYENNILYSISSSINKPIEFLVNILNGFAKAILPFNKVLKEGMEFISLFFYIAFSSFIWLVILAIKRSTKR